MGLPGPERWCSQLQLKSALLNPSQQGGEGLGIIGHGPPGGKTPELTALYALPPLPFGLKV
ncbi:unnamed protein product [Clonostachys chloroleuca]|uniref:Uncharacterized protein n=1 Tax=Clonostachys chloroleuca TaxID=1926264 RepID=A0AA35Q3L1_9HYPO|nr:unnamed protein product [Clonostachys chloroleuca]